MGVDKQAAIFGTVGAIIFCGFLGYWLTSIAYNLPLLAIVCLSILGICLALAHWLDKKASAQPKDRQSAEP